MTSHTNHDNATSNVLAWRSHAANMQAVGEEESSSENDEPPDRKPPHSPIETHFKRTAVRKQSAQHHQSLLTKALHDESDDEPLSGKSSLFSCRRRRSITSNVSVASADLTSDTGITSPARTGTPSPRLPSLSFAPFSHEPLVLKDAHARDNHPVRLGQVRPQHTTGVNAGDGRDAPIQVPEKKRCISFACAAKPGPTASKAPSPPHKLAAAPTQTATREAPKKSCIKFACPTKPVTLSTPPKRQLPPAAIKTPSNAAAGSEGGSPNTIRKQRSPSTRSHVSSTPRRYFQSPMTNRTRKFLTANTNDLQTESSRFHEFASDEPQEDDWIRRELALPRRKLTLDDITCMQKETAIRRLGKEAEEEAEEEEDELEGDNEDDDDEGEEDEDDDEIDEDEERDIEDDESGSGSDGASDGYHTDNEVGFADSDDEKDDDLELWNPAQRLVSAEASVVRRPSFGSDSSAYSRKHTSPEKTRRIRIKQETPELPDSTDFVCGTLDEDRPLEDAYMNCIAARKREKLRLIPQDIDPSFPTSEPEDDDEDTYNPGHQDSDEPVWLHGEIEDIDQNQKRPEWRRKKSDGHSPKRLHSPPPKGRGRSPRRLFDHHSPRRLRSPAPTQVLRSPPATPVQTGQGIPFEKVLAARPALTHTKSLPRRPAIFRHAKNGGRRSRGSTMTKQEQVQHIRGAIDIVKGLERKRQRRKEKFQQKYCNRARKGQIPERKPLPGKGAERMKEIGLLMAGKIGQGNYVISI